MLKLNADPTFRAAVPISVPGTREPEKVHFTFRHQKKDELKQFLATAKEMKDEDYVLAVAMGWELSEEFNRENVQRLLQNYHGAAQAIAATYVFELSGLGNRGE